MSALLRTRLAGLTVLALFGAPVGCITQAGDYNPGLVSFDVGANGQLGTKASPLPFSLDPVPVTLSVTARDINGELYPFSGFAEVTADNAELTSADGTSVFFYSSIELKDGLAQPSTLFVRQGAGEVRLWVGVNSEPGEYPTGVSQPLYFKHPLLADTQLSVKDGASQLAGRRVRIEEGRLVVTGVQTDGFYVTDADAPNLEWGHMFVFSFSRPAGIDIGDTLQYVEGSITDFAGIFTEFNNPTWEEDNRFIPIPPPIVLTSEMLAARRDTKTGVEPLEKFEAALVRVENVQVQAPDEESEYLRYKQWPVKLNGGTGASVKIVSEGAARNFDPLAKAGTVMRSITGNLRNIPRGPSQGRPNATPWVIYIRDANDLQE